MKKVKRILAILLLTVAAIVIGYLIFTGGRLQGINEQTETEVTSYVQTLFTY